MKTYTQLLNLYQEITLNRSTANQTLGATLINESVRTMCNVQGGKLRFLEATEDMYTVASQETYEIPNKFRKLMDMYIYSGSGSSSDTIYMPEMVFDPTKWKLVKAYRFGTQDVPYFTYVENTTYKIQPIPSSSGNLITLRGRLNIRDMTIADYTTGTIVSIANEGTTVTGSGTTWTADMVGRYIQITQTTAANGGDGFWYEIGGFTNATTIALKKPYQGTSITAGSASYTIGQVPIIPEAYQMGILYRSAALYWQTVPDMSKATQYWMLYDGGKEIGKTNDYGGIVLEMLENEGETEEGAYIPPFSRSSTIIQTPYYFPYQQASGF